MKRFLFALSILLFFTSLISAEESSTDLLDSDLDSLFEDTIDDESVSEESSDSDLVVKEENTAVSLLDDLTKETGFTFSASYALMAALAPGWSEAPWYWGDEDEDFSNVIGAELNSQFGLDFQLTPTFRVKQVFSLDFPDYDMEVDQFWGEYNFLDKAYFKMGLMSVSWGLSSNYSYTNLLARIPEGSDGGDMYAVVMNKPIGIGGLQLVALTRPGFVGSGLVEDVEANDLGYGLKYNLALEEADINTGFFYHSDMNLRGFTSLKSTIWGNTEVYAEGLISVDNETLGDPLYSGSFGFGDDFFDDRLTVNAEYFYNGERYTYYTEEDDDLIEEEESPYVYGHNYALNLYYRPIKGNSLRFFSRCLYNYNENSGKWLPGLTYKPQDDIKLYLAVPVALGASDGTYYSSNYDEDNRPFSVTFALTISGNYKFARYE